MAQPPQDGRARDILERGSSNQRVGPHEESDPSGQITLVIESQIFCPAVMDNHRSAHRLCYS